MRVVELAVGPHLNRGAVGEKRLGDLLEVLHVRPEDHRLAEDRRLEDVVPAVIGEAAADEHRRRHLIELRQLADRVEHHDVGARLGVDRQLRSPRRDEPGLAREPLDFGEPLRMTRRENQQRMQASIALTRSNAFRTAASSPRIVLPATMTVAVRRDPEEAQHPLARLAVDGRPAAAPRANRTSGCRSR